jgi:hypothetical protein
MVKKLLYQLWHVAAESDHTMGLVGVEHAAVQSIIYYYFNSFTVATLRINMHLTLMCNAHCASAWGLHDGMEFTRDGSDEMLRELVLYLTSRASRSRAWVWEMVYHVAYNSTTDDTRVVNHVNGWQMWQF